MKKYIAFLWLMMLSLQSFAVVQPKYSTAGFYTLPETNRKVFSLNPGWRFYKGSILNAEKVLFNDHAWETVSLPHGLELVPTEASGCINYQGEVWYRKHFFVDDSLKNKKLFVHFEAIMGKSKVWINGVLLKENFGGYLPIIVDATDHIKWNDENVISVWADNSNDPTYPPGKDQEVLDFLYFGGIYRDCWLVSHNKVHITNANYENKVNGGGLVVSSENVSQKQATVNLKLQVRNDSKLKFNGKAQFVLEFGDSRTIYKYETSVAVSDGEAIDIKGKINIPNPQLWSPEHPNLYHLIIKIYDKKGNVVDGYKQRVGVKSIDFRGNEGLWLNGAYYPQKLIGVNRHQDFAVIGNALPNSLHWRDAKKLKDAGFKIIRNAHYPQDPAFMDACDELGLFVIVNTPGWQFWNEAPVFEQRVYHDIRQMVRRDRNHASLFLWEPVLNETWYPDWFAANVRNIVKKESPWQETVSDAEAKGNENFIVKYAHPSNGDTESQLKDKQSTISYFTREWGDNVDDWNSHNSTSRVHRSWGEIPMLIQATHYAKPTYQCTNYESLCLAGKEHIGGCLWHPFDHQRGYHPDPFYGGIMDIFRQPKYSYYMFQSQRSATKQSDRLFETGPMVYIAHEMTPFSPQDITVYSNCDEVRLTVNKNGNVYTHKKDITHKGMPSPVITFKSIYDFMEDKNLSRQDKQEDVFLLAEGIINDSVVATHLVTPALRPEKLLLWVDDENVPLLADGSDIVTVVAAIADKNGIIKRLNNQTIDFSIEGEGQLLTTSTKSVPLIWGTAPILIKSTVKAGTIKVRAAMSEDGSQIPLSAEIIIQSKTTAIPLIYKQTEIISNKSNVLEKTKSYNEDEIMQLRKIINQYRLKEVEKQQTEFGE